MESVAEPFPAVEVEFVAGSESYVAAVAVAGVVVEQLAGQESGAVVKLAANASVAIVLLAVCLTFVVSQAVLVEFGVTVVLE